MNIFQKFIDYVKNSKIELKKVVWPDRRKLFNHTFLVIGISVGVAFFLGLIDFVLNKTLEVILK